jgi:hypothetical protein
MILVTKAEKIASIHGNYIYTIKETALVPIVYKIRNTMEEGKYKNILQNLNLCNGFYFSYSYDCNP